MDVHIGVFSLDGGQGSRISGLLRDGGYRVSEHDSLASLQARDLSDPLDMVVVASVPGEEGSGVLPEEDALAIRTMRDLEVPLLVVSQAMDESAVVRALRIGADRCIGHPFGPAEFLARVEALLRRHWQWGAPQRSGEPEEVVVDAISCAVIVDGREVRLTPTEYRLLSKLVESKGDVVPNEELYSHIWGLDHTASPSSLRLYISHLRKKLEMDPHKPRLIRTKWGVGYYLEAKTVTT